MSHVNWTLITDPVKRNCLQFQATVLLSFQVFCLSLGSVTLCAPIVTASEPLIVDNMTISDLGIVQITSYQPIPAQTKPECINRFKCTTSIDDGITQFGAAVSQDLLKSGIVQYGDVLSIPGLGFRIVNDAMGSTKCVHRNDKGRCTKRIPQVKAIDLMVFSFEEEHRI